MYLNISMKKKKKKTIHPSNNKSNETTSSLLFYREILNVIRIDFDIFWHDFLDSTAGKKTSYLHKRDSFIFIFHCGWNFSIPTQKDTTTSTVAVNVESYIFSIQSKKEVFCFILKNISNRTTLCLHFFTMKPQIYSVPMENWWWW